MKRFFDFTVSLLMILVLLPVFLLVSIIIAVDAGRPVIYKQYRVGKDNKLFYIYKFRTMKNNTRLAATKDLTEADSVITKSGRFLRKTSLDELPQIWDIFIGNMSVVGPRPGLWNQDLLTAERDKYGANDIMPGLTGLAQISGRDELPIDVKARLDGEYVEKMSLLFDIKCIVNTALQVIKHEGVVEGGTGAINK